MKWIVGFIMTFLVWSAGMTLTWANSMPVGVLPEDFTSITVIRKGDIPENPRLLYEGDRLKGAGVTNLDICWHPGAQAVFINEEEMVVTLEQGTEKTLWTQVQQFLGFGEAETQVAMNVTRGQQELAPIVPLPGFSVTLLAGEPVQFTWGNVNGQTLIFQDEHQNTIFRKSITELRSIRLSPEEIGLTPGQSYTWKVDGLPGSCQVVLLGPEIFKQVDGDLQKIDGVPGSAGEKILRKAAYLQLVSDVYPSKIDLYWLSYRLLEDCKTMESKHQGTVQMLQKRVASHLTGPLYNFIPNNL